MRHAIAIGAVAVALAGCDTTGAILGAAEGRVERAVKQTERLNDTEARAYKRAPCAVSVGAYFRMLDERERRAVDVLCGGDNGPIQPGGQEGAENGRE